MEKELDPIVDHHLSNVTMCICVIIDGCSYIPPKLVVICQTIAISDSALDLGKKRHASADNNHCAYLFYAQFFPSDIICVVWCESVTFALYWFFPHQKNNIFIHQN